MFTTLCSLWCACVAEEVPPINWPLNSAQPKATASTSAAPRNEWMVKFSNNFTRARQAPVDLLFQGDSISDWWIGNGTEVWQKNYARYHAATFGIAGDRTENLLWRLKQGELGSIKPKLIVLMIGTNNLGRDTVEEVRDGILACVAELRRLCPESKILLLGIFPRGEGPNNLGRRKVAAVNELLAASSFDEKVSYLDIGKIFIEPDGTISREVMYDFLHPTPQGYERWAAAIEPYVTKYLQGK